ncbi:type VI secretion system baseplate subunit TssF, partial [Vibrio alfacsensis]
ARLLDGVALLNAKTEMALETQYSQVIDSLIDVIYPSINQRVPSIGYAELNAPDGITENANIPIGSQFSNMIGEQECLFQTVDNLAVNPFTITDISAT